MSDKPPRPSAETLAAVDRLASALVDGTCTRPEQAQLESLLLAHPEARERFRTFMHAESILAWKFSVPGHEGPEARERSGDEESPAVSARRRGRWPVGIAGKLAAAAAAVAAGVFLGWGFMRPTPRPAVSEVPAPVITTAAPIIARVIGINKAKWANGVEVAVGEVVPQGPIRLVSGEAQITFASGAIVTLHAPAELEVLSAERVFLRHGRITPFVPPAAHGFTVVSPSGEVVDLGTEFTVGVDAAGRTDVFVIDGEVDVASGHDRPREDRPLRMTQGYGSRLVAGDAEPVTIQRPIVIDHFEGPEARLRRVEIDAEFPSRVANGVLQLPIAAPPGRKHSITRTVLDHDFSSFAGRRSTISYKVTLPSAGTSTEQRWLALVIDAGIGAPPKGWEPAPAAVLVSPEWQVGVRVDGEPICQSYVFSRGEDAIGPYQVVVSIDDTPATRAAHGSATWSVMVNGNELFRDWPFRLPSQPRLSLQAFAEPYSGCDGVAIVDDLSVSVADEPTAAAQ